MRQVKEVPIEKVITNRPRRLVNIDLPLQSNKPILVDKIGENYMLIDGAHRLFKNIEMGNKTIKAEIRNG